MERSDKELSSSPTPKSDSSVQTIISRYDHHDTTQNQSHNNKSSTNTQLNNNSNPLNTVLSESQLLHLQNSNHHHQQNQDGHLYNTPEFLKKDEEILSTPPHTDTINGKHPHGNIHNNNNVSASSSITLITTPKTKKDTENLPVTIWLGIVQLLLSVAMTALGVLMLARGSTLSNTGAGIWAGCICGIAGALSVINVRKALTGVLAMSLVCVATSTLAIALTGTGLVRDINLNSSKGTITSGSGLLFALSIHFIVSVLTVYFSAIRQCSKTQNKNSGQMVDNVLISNNSAYLSHQRVEQYFKSLANDPNAKGVYPTLQSHKNAKKPAPLDKHGFVNREKYIPMWLTQGKHMMVQVGGTLPHPRQMVLVPAGMTNKLMPMHVPPPPPSSIMYQQRPPIPLPPGVPHPYPPYPSMMPPYSPDVAEKLNRLRSQSKEKHRRRSARRKSESDMDENRQAFTYTGLDRAIADSFLEQQEKQNVSLDCNSINENGGKCADIVM